MTTYDAMIAARERARKARAHQLAVDTDPNSAPGERITAAHRCWEAVIAAENAEDAHNAWLEGANEPLDNG